MFKKYIFTAFFLSMLAGTLIAEETKGTPEIEESIIECDEKFDKCAEKCGDSSSDTCMDQCEENANKCYETYVFDPDDVPPTEDGEDDPKIEIQDIESESVPSEAE